MSVFVGNDVVDLANPRTEGRATDERFVARVFDLEEREAIATEGGSDVELWSRWAAKEAAFKAISKVIGLQPTFLHRTFKVEWAGEREADAGEGARDDPEESVVRRGAVLHADHVARVSVRLRPGAVHAVAFCTPNGEAPAVDLHRRVARLDESGSCWAGRLEDLMGRFSQREAGAVRSLESAAVRLGARQDVARMLGVLEERVEIVCDPGPATRRPPRVLVDGRGAPADVSLSHDGRWIAWAIWVGT
jgi:phosphopantetheinyl transferase (holo-ACP synthase)